MSKLVVLAVIMFAVGCATNPTPTQIPMPVLAPLATTTPTPVTAPTSGWLSSGNDVIEGLKNVATIIAIIVGGWWSYNKFIKRRLNYPRGKIAHRITYIPLTGDKVLLHVTVDIFNPGDMLLSVKSAETRIQQVLPLSEELWDLVKKGDDPVLEDRREIEWPLLGSREALPREGLEMLVWDLFRVEWGDRMAVRHGRSGQRQHGVDIYGREKQGSGIVGIQVKGKTAGFGAQLTEAEMRSEVEKAGQFSPPLRRFVFVTSAPRDALVQHAARALSDASEAKGSFSIDVLGWEDVEDRLTSYPDLLRMYYPELFGGSVPELTRVLRSILDEQRRESEATMLRARPRFELVPTSWSVDGRHLTPEFSINQSGGDPVSFIKWRFLEPLTVTETRTLYPSQFSRCLFTFERFQGYPGFE